MAVDAVGPAGPIGLTVPPPPSEQSTAETEADYEESEAPESAPLPQYQGSTVDETV